MAGALVFWFTGLSGAGKTTLALTARAELTSQGLDVLVLDGDEIRARYARPLGFSEEEIKRNNEFLASICVKERSDYDVILVPIISPFECSRREAQERLGGGFYEIYCAAELDCLERRDVKGLYAKAHRGEITDLIGFSKGTRYEPPRYPDFVTRTCEEPIEQSAEKLIRFIFDKVAISGTSKNPMTGL